MSDLISRDKAVAAVLATSIEYQLIYGKKEPKEGFVRSLIKSIANIPQEETERTAEPEEVIPHRNYKYLSDYWCECGRHLGKKGEVKYCAECGRKVNWNG